MKVTRRCPLCDNKTTMQIDEWCIQNNRTDVMGVVEYKFYKYGHCPVCQKIIYNSKRDK